MFKGTFWFESTRNQPFYRRHPLSTWVSSMLLYFLLYYIFQGTSHFTGGIPCPRGCRACCYVSRVVLLPIYCWENQLLYHWRITEVYSLHQLSG